MAGGEGGGEQGSRKGEEGGSEGRGEGEGEEWGTGAGEEGGGWPATGGGRAWIGLEWEVGSGRLGTKKDKKLKGAFFGIEGLGGAI